MKRILTLAVSLLTVMTFTVTAFAHTPASKNELSSMTSLPDKSHMISVGLTSSESKTDAADIGDLKHGLSVIGFSKFNSTVAAISDGLWASSPGNWEVDGTTYYNAKGETGKSDSIYKSLVTYNFGKKMDFEAFGYFTNGVNAYLGAADLYVSDDGVNWKLIGYYNNMVKIADDITKGYDAATITDPADANGATLDAAKRGCPFWSLSGASGQYLRVAVVNGNQIKEGKADPDNKGCSFREMVVYGTEHKASSDPSKNPSTFDTVSASVTVFSLAVAAVVCVKKKKRL